MPASTPSRRYEIPRGGWTEDCHECGGPHRQGIDVRLSDGREVMFCSLCALNHWSAGQIAALPMDTRYQEALDEARRDFEATALADGWL